MKSQTRRASGGISLTTRFKDEHNSPTNKNYDVARDEQKW